ncbi:WD40-like Beta Propeller Repeat [Filimonas lacunae]|uniref:WD40-like Beta Propeller Repeat n=1 Tax=Filimonas lacunae TaxID=477680 RepID=A0A173MMQ3_9BACT|nr:OmpA family protein [Filimonas lacunae]BAV08749.1 outer membrane lipoprotein omp16 precursor [Filimonas lacunae]SIS61083.1 WD40-like Beta Propeller Repeat [Filimonas lacunae]
MEKLVLLLALFVTLSGNAQYNPEKVNKKALQAYEKAMLQLRDGFIKDAVPLLSKAIEYDANYVDAYLSLAGVYGELKNYAKSIEYYQLANSKDSDYCKIYNLSYSINLAGAGRFTEALQAVEKFMSIPTLNERSKASGQYRLNCFRFAVNYAATHKDSSYVFAPINLGDSINTEKNEFYPSFTIDDSLFVFTRHGEGVREDFIESTLLHSPDRYSKWEVINGSINVEPSKGAINISQDGEWLLFAGNFANQGLGNFDLYISYNTPEGWSEPVNLGPNVNTDFWESAPTISPDKNALYFSSSRPGGYGGKDLYVSYRQPNGRWSRAVNMGPSINTRGDEQAPFIHADNMSLYFTSDGLPGYGSADIFIARKQSDGSWGTPENLGYPINTIEHEGTLYVASNGITAYYASDRSDSRGGLDLYRFDMRPEVRPIKTLYVKGTVSDATTGKGIPSTVELTDNQQQKTITKIQTDETGHYFITLPTGKDYTFTVNRKGYLFYSDIYALSNKPADTTYQKDIPLQPIVLNATVTLKNIQFNSNSTNLEPVSKIELDKLVQLLGDNFSLHVQISGHTDNTGNAAQNIALSTSRAKSVVDYLVSKGIDAKRLTWKGYGSAKPIADNNTEIGKALNRRTEFTITGL